MDLPQGLRFFPPPGIDEALLTPSFLRSDSDTETRVLTQVFKIQHLPPSRLYLRHVFPRLGELACDVRGRCMERVVGELPRLAMEDEEMRGVMVELAFVPTGKGKMEAPCR